MNSLIFPVYLVGKDTFTALPEHQELFYFSLHHYFLNLRYSPHIYMLTSNLLDTLDRPSLSLLDSLSLMASLLLCPVNTSFLDLSRPSSLSPPLREYTRALLQFPLLEPWLENSLKLVSWAIVELTFFVSYLPFLHCLLSSVLKTSLIFFFCIAFLYYYCCFRQNKSSPCYSILIQRGIFWPWLERENKRSNLFEDP